MCGSTDSNRMLKQRPSGTSFNGEETAVDCSSFSPFSIFGGRVKCGVASSWCCANPIVVPSRMTECVACVVEHGSCDASGPSSVLLQFCAWCTLLSVFRFAK